MSKLPRIHVGTPVLGRLSRYSNCLDVIFPRDTRPGTKICGKGKFRSMLIPVSEQWQFLLSFDNFKFRKQYQTRFFRETEKWTINDDGIGKELIEPTLYDYTWYPELFLVDESYCSNFKNFRLNFISLRNPQCVLLSDFDYETFYQKI